MTYVIKYEDGIFNRDEGHEATLREATRYSTREAAEVVLSQVMGGEIVLLSDLEGPRPVVDAMRLLENPSHDNILAAIILLEQALTLTSKTKTPRADDDFGYFGDEDVQNLIDRDRE